MSTFINEGNAEFQLKVSEIKDVIFFPTQVHGSPEFCAWVSGEGFLPWFSSWCGNDLRHMMPPLSL